MHCVERFVCYVSHIVVCMRYEMMQHTRRVTMASVCVMCNGAAVGRVMLATNRVFGLNIRLEDEAFALSSYPLQVPLDVFSVDLSYWSTDVSLLLVYCARVRAGISRLVFVVSAGSCAIRLPRLRV